MSSRNSNSESSEVGVSNSVMESPPGAEKEKFLPLTVQSTAVLVVFTYVRYFGVHVCRNVAWLMLPLSYCGNKRLKFTNIKPWPFCFVCRFRRLEFGKADSKDSF